MCIRDSYYSAVYLLCAIIIGILIIVMYWYLFIANKKTVHTMFLIVGIAMGLVYFAFIPEYETPDELRHMETAYSLSLIHISDLKMENSWYIRDFMILPRWLLCRNRTR